MSNRMRIQVKRACASCKFWTRLPDAKPEAKVIFLPPACRCTNKDSARLGEATDGSDYCDCWELAEWLRPLI